MLQSNRINHVFSAKHWLQSGWGVYRQSPVTWTFMILFFSIAYIVAASSLPGKVIAALLTPVFLGGIYVAVFKADNGESISMESLFSMFKDRQRLKQLLIIGGIGVAVVALSYLVENMAGSVHSIGGGEDGSLVYTDSTPGQTLLKAIYWIWMLASIFSIPLVAIANQRAIESIVNSMFAAFFNLLPIFIFFACAVLLTILGAIPFGLGLFVVIPTLFCAVYFIFKSVYFDGNDTASVTLRDSTTPLTAGFAAKSVPDLAPDLAVEESSGASSGVARDSALESVQDLAQKSPQGFSGFMVDTIKNAQIMYGPRDKADVSLPRGFTLNYYDDNMQITRNWKGLGTITVFICAALFNGLWLKYGFIEFLSGDRRLSIIVFCLLFGVVAAVSLYAFIANVLNETEVYVNKNAISIRHHPVPWPGNKTVETSNIKQIYVKTVGGSGDGRKNYRYNVTGLTSGNQKIKLISGLTDIEHGHFFEKKIEDYLSIIDEEVADERRY